MIGNDIIDFQQVALESNWQRKGYLDKLFCWKEQELIFESLDPNQMVWLLWSMKEAGYKIYFREKLERIYNPKSIICNNLFIDKRSASADIHYNDQNYYCKSIINKDFVHTSAVIQSTVLNTLLIFIGSNKPGHNGLINNCGAVINEHYPLGYRISKDHHNIPNLLNEDTGERYPISISHHGRFLSAILLPNNTLV